MRSLKYHIVKSACRMIKEITSPPNGRIVKRTHDMSRLKEFEIASFLAKRLK